MGRVCLTSLFQLHAPTVLPVTWQEARVGQRAVLAADSKKKNCFPGRERAPYWADTAHCFPGRERSPYRADTAAQWVRNKLWSGWKALTRCATLISLWKKSKQCLATEISQGKSQLRYCLLKDTCETHFFKSQFKTDLLIYTSTSAFNLRKNVS